MNDLASWFSRQAAKTRRAVLLEDALLGGKFAAYAWHRLRFFLARYILSSTLHTVQVILLFKFFSLRQFQGLLLIQAACALASGFWWGSLEAMRGRVRTLQRDRLSHRLPQEIAQWLNLSFWPAAAAILFLLLSLLAPTALGPGSRAFGPADLYLAAILLRLAMDFVARTYHSGVYALRRVYRPLPSILATEIVGFGAVLAAWPWLRTWSLPLAFLVSSLASQALLFRFTGRAYKQLGLPVWPSAKGKKQNRGFASSWREWLAAGSSYALMRLDSLLVLGLFRFGPGRTGDTVSLVMLFFLLAPTVRAGFEWAQLFYFDLKRLETPLHKNLKMRFDRDVFKLAAGLGLAFWAVAALAGTIFLAKSLGAIYGLLLLFFPVRSMLAALQMKSYAEGRYFLLFLSGVVSLAGLAALRWAPLGAGARLAGLTLALALGAAIFIPGRHSPWRQPQGRGLRCLPDWLTETLEVKCPLAISALTLASDPAARQGRRTGAGWVQFQFARTLAARLGEQGAAAMSGPNRIVWFDTGRAKPRVGSRGPRLKTGWVLANSAGWTESLRSTGFQPQGKSALQAALALGFLGPELDAAALSVEKPLTAVDVEAEFRKWAPGGIVFDPSRSEPAALRALAPSERRGILLEALSFISGASPFPNRTPFHVTAFAQGGALRLIFLIDRRKPYALKAGWGSWLWRRNLEAALNGRAARPKGR